MMKLLVFLFLMQDFITCGLSCPQNCRCYLTIIRCLPKRGQERLTRVPIDGIARSTTVLDLRQNEILKIMKDDFKDLPQLNKLYLNNNKIRYIEPGAFSSLKNLKHLYLYDNYLRNITVDIFAGLSNLEHLYIYRNQIEHVAKNAFRDLKKLKRLSLWSNRIKEIKEEVLEPLTNLGALRLDDNRLKCNCDLLLTLEAYKQKHFNRHIFAVCFSPWILRGRLISMIKHKDFNCSRPTRFTKTPENTVAISGNVVRLMCRASGFPRPEIAWKKDGFLLAATGRRKILAHGDLEINPVRQEDHGYYTCEVRNSISSISHTATIVVKECLFDRRTDCGTLVLNGECQFSKTYMEHYCCMACKGKEECQNSFNSEQCTAMAAKGECVKNKKWMWDKCCNACKKKGRCVNLGGSRFVLNCEAQANLGACNKAATRDNMWRYCCADCLKVMSAMASSELTAWEPSKWAQIPEYAVKETLKLLMKIAPTKYAQLEAEPSKKKELIAAAMEAAGEQVKLANHFKEQPGNIEAVLRRHLPEDRISKLQGALSIPTFRMSIDKKDDGVYWVSILRDGKEFYPSFALATAVNIEHASIYQKASIVVEGVMLLMSASGISVSPGQKVIRETVEETVQAIRASSKFQKAIDAFGHAWNAAGGNALAKAKALFYLMKETYSARLLWTIISSLCSHMEWYDWLLTGAKVSALIIAALATEGEALIAEIALIILGAVDFARKVANLNTLSEVMKTI